MSLDSVIRDYSTGNGASVDVNHRLLVALPTSGSGIAAVKAFSENDSGDITGTPTLRSPEVDSDYRLRVSQDTFLDNHIFNYANQDTGKHTYSATTMSVTWAAGGMTVNANSTLANNTGCTAGTYAVFPLIGATSLYCESEWAFNINPPQGVAFDAGLFARSASTPYTPADGVYFRVESAGIQGIANYAGVETSTGVFPTSDTDSDPWSYALNKKYRFVITTNNRETQFWIDDVLMGSIMTPAAQAQPFASSALPFSVRQANTSVVGAALTPSCGAYVVSIGGCQFADAMGPSFSRMLGSYQGFSGGTMGSIVSGTITSGTLVNPTAAVPSPTALTANLPTGLGGRIWEQTNAGLGVNADGIFSSYTVPASALNTTPRRLRLTGVKLTGYVQSALTGGPAINEWMLSFGSNGDSLAGSEGAATKAPRRVMLPELTQAITATQAASTMLSQPGGSVCTFDQPIYVNPGERVQLVCKHVGTAVTAGVLAYNYQFVYSWE